MTGRSTSRYEDFVTKTARFEALFLVLYKQTASFDPLRALGALELAEIDIILVSLHGQK
jgi:hypothetical protein